MQPLTIELQFGSSALKDLLATVDGFFCPIIPEVNLRWDESANKDVRPLRESAQIGPCHPEYPASAIPDKGSHDGQGDGCHIPGEKYV